MNQSSVLMVEGPRPALGVLVFHDGYRLILDRSVVVGRTAEADIGKSNRAVIGVSLGDYAPFLSIKHATLSLEEWDVTIVDHGSTNGTSLYDAAHHRWHRLAPNRPYVLTPGTNIAFGRYVGMFQSSLRPQVA
jgi:pSer/pThr/pTyr-binding forkhead associated (FHA) protein